MGLMHVTFDDITVTPMREAGKTFADADVPSGTDSVYYKAAKMLRNDYNKVFTSPIPEFTQLEIDAKITAKKATLSAVDEYTDETLNLYEQTEVVNPSAEAIQNKIDSARGFVEAQAQHIVDTYGTKTLEEQKAVMRRKENGTTVPDLTEQEATAVIVDEYKTYLATEQVRLSINNCLVVPTLSQEFKDQFTVSTST